MTETILDAALRMTRLSLRFARVDRVTMHEDGQRPETDTDHSYMLGLMGCALASKFEPSLNLGLISQYALIHDLVEVYAGDTNTAVELSADERREKKDRENRAFIKLQIEFRSLPWIPGMILDYEKLIKPEARYIKVLDKVLPKLTHILNDLAVVAIIPYDRYHDEQRQMVMRYASQWPWLVELWEESVQAVIKMMQRKQL